jgi:hypothetical protein
MTALRPSLDAATRDSILARRRSATSPLPVLRCARGHRVGLQAHGAGRAGRSPGRSPDFRQGFSHRLSGRRPCHPAEAERGLPDPFLFLTEPWPGNDRLWPSLRQATTKPPPGPAPRHFAGAVPPAVFWRELNPRLGSWRWARQRRPGSRLVPPQDRADPVRACRICPRRPALADGTDAGPDGFRCEWPPSRPPLVALRDLHAVLAPHGRGEYGRLRANPSRGESDPASR